MPARKLIKTVVRRDDGDRELERRI